MTKYVFQQSAFAADEVVSVAPYASFTFTDAATGLPASLWSDEAGTVPITGNEALADEHGFVRAYLTAGIYDVVILSGSASKTLTDVAIGAEYDAVAAAVAATAADRIQTGLDVVAAADSVATATTQADNSAASAAESVASALDASLSADAAAVESQIYESVALGVAATTSGQYFLVKNASSNVYIDRYKNVSGSGVFDRSYPSYPAVAQPAGTGKLQGWCDPFFRRVGIGGALAGKNRYHPATGITTLEFAANTAFDGRALRKNTSGTGNLAGPRIYLGDFGASAGDTITLCMLVTGAGAAVQFKGRPLDVNGTSIGSQFSAGATVTSSSTPQLMSVEVVTPANCDSVYLYPYTTTSGGYFDVVALWAVKGAATAAPTWPTISEDLYYRLRDADLTTATSTNATQNSTLDYMVVGVTAVAAATTAVNLAVTAASINTQYSNPFTGWGERYTPAGISFNAVRIKNIGRDAATTTKKWRTINVAIRTGATPHNSGATLVAVGSAYVNPDTEALTDVIVVLKDPSTGAVKTLTDADFSGGEYLIGVYAQDSAGAGAGMSAHTATQSNALGSPQSYYITSANAQTGSWTPWSGNKRLGVDHLLLTTPVESTAYEPTPAFVLKLNSTQAITAPTIAVPPKLYYLQGVETSVYFDNLIMDDADFYNWDVAGASVGVQQAERLQVVPTGSVSSHTVTLSVADKKSAAILASATLTAVGVASSAGSGTTKTALIVGDSLTQAGVITQTLLDLAAADVMGLTLIGTRGSGSNLHEGRGGWRVDDYATAGRTFYQFTVSGVTTAPQINSTEYTNNSSTFKVQEVSLSGGSGTITCERVSGSNAPSASGTLTKTTGTGDATIAFSVSSAVSGNPFWIGGAVNFPQYLTDNSLATPDWVFVLLGTNDIFSQTSDAGAASQATTQFALLNTLITSIKAAGAGVKVALIPPPCPSYSQDSFGSSYSAGQTRARFKRNVISWCAQLYSTYSNSESNRIYICPATVGLDTVNNMQRAAAAPVNSRSAVTVERQNNGVHPATSGYQQIGDAVWAFLKNQ